MGFSHETVHLSDAEFKILRDLIRERTGLNYDNNRRDVLEDKLSRRVIDRGFDSFIDYYYLLKYDPGANEEWPRVLDALSVAETYFWREMGQIRTLVDVVAPQYFAAGPAEPLRIWCAACATGEEPLTIAMALQEAGWFNRGRFEITASDGSPDAVAKARRGVYRERSFRALPDVLRQKHFTPVDGAWRVAPELHARVRWATANLSAEEEVARQLPAAVVFCRNVFIYFAGDAVAQTVRWFAEGMTNPGCLFVGASESLVRFTTDFDLQELGGAFVYVKRGAGV